MHARFDGNYANQHKGRQLVRTSDQMGCKQQEQQGSNSGLAYLVHNPSSSDAPSQTALLMDYVYQLPQSASDAVSKTDGEVIYPELDARVNQHLAALKQQAALTAASSLDSTTASQGAAASAAAAAGPSSSSQTAAGTASEQPRGRVGPRDVAIDRSSVCGSFGFSTDGLTLEALGNFTSCRANTAVFAGKWFYECTVLTSGIQQVGFGGNTLQLPCRMSSPGAAKVIYSCMSLFPFGVR